MSGSPAWPVRRDTGRATSSTGTSFHRFLALILRKARQFAGFDLADRGAQWCSWGKDPGETVGDAGREGSVVGAGLGGVTGRVLPGESAGPAPIHDEGMS